MTDGEPTLRPDHEALALLASRKVRQGRLPLRGSCAAEGQSAGPFANRHAPIE